MAKDGASRNVRRASGLSFLRDRSATLLANGALVLTGVVTSIAISRLLGPSGRGDYVSWQAWASAIGVAALAGLPQVVVIDDWSARRHHFTDLLTPLAVTATVGVAVVCATGLLLLEANRALLGLLLVVATTQTGAVTASEAQRLGRMTGLFNVVRLLPPLTALILMCVLVAVGNRSSATWLTVIAGGQLFVLTVTLVAVTRNARLQPKVPQHLQKTLVASARLGPGAWVTMLQYRADVLAVSLIFPPSVVGYYAVGIAAQAAVAAVGQMNGQHWFSRGSHGSNSRSASLGRELLRTVGLTLACGAILALTALWWIPALYGQAFNPALWVVVGLCGSAVVQSVDYLLAHEMLLLGRGEQVLIYRIPGCIVLLVGFWLVAIFDLGPAAAALCTGLGFAVSSGLMATVARRHRRHLAPA